MISDSRPKSTFPRKFAKFVPKPDRRTIRTLNLLTEDRRTRKPRSSTTIRPIRVLEMYRAPLDRSRNSFWLRPILICLAIIVFTTLALISYGAFQQPLPVTQVSYFGGRVYQVQVGGMLANTWQASVPSKQPIPQKTFIRGKGPYQVQGQPTLSGSFIDQVLVAYHSPAAGQGQVLYDLGVKYQIDPAVALAFFLQDNRLGTMGKARITHSLGNTGCVKVFPCLVGHPYYPDWKEGFAQWYQLIRNLYIAQMQRRTLETIIPKYSPQLDPGGKVAYINALTLSLDTWHSGRLIVVKSG